MKHAMIGSSKIHSMLKRGRGAGSRLHRIRAFPRELPSELLSRMCRVVPLSMKSAPCQRRIAGGTAEEKSFGLDERLIFYVKKEFQIRSQDYETAA
jgi:hypothetical protein